MCLYVAVFLLFYCDLLLGVVAVLSLCAVAVCCCCVLLLYVVAVCYALFYCCVMLLCVVAVTRVASF